MKIKGAFPVRWAVQKGEDGQGVTITTQEVKYAVSTTTTRPTSGWSTVMPTSIADGNYLWTWTHVLYSDGTATDAYSVARQGIDGKGIKSSVVTYSLQKFSVDPDTITDWGAFPSALTDGYWLYTRTVITYSEGDTTTSYSVSQVGTGAYYAGVAEYYAAGDSASVCPDGAAAAGTYATGVNIQTSWKQERPTLTAETPYLWNFEISSDSRGNRYVTDARCIGNFAKGIVSIVETYAISAYGYVESGRDYPSDIAANDWQDEHQASVPTDSKPYQWNRTVTTYNDGSTATNYHLSAIKGLDGKGTTYIDLDNENDCILYDGNGNNVSGSLTSNIRLYANGEDKTSGQTFSISEKSSTVSASVSGSVLTVTGITSSDGYVIVKCTYNSVAYYARMTIKRLQGTDKYEVVCTPSSITYNDTTGEGNSDVVVNVYRTAQNGSRTLLSSLPTGYKLLRYWTDTSSSVDMTSSYTGGQCSFTPNAANWSRYRIVLQDASGNMLDYETIPIGHVSDGAKGSDAFIVDADNENIGFIVDDTGAVSSSQSRTVNLNAYYGSSAVSGVPYSAAAANNTDASGNTLLYVSLSSGVLTLTTNTAAVWQKTSAVKITITATHATYGSRSIVIYAVPVFGGTAADFYELLPSLSAITFSKTSDGTALTPSSRTLTVQCRHITASTQDAVSVPSGYSVRYSYASQPTTSSSGSAMPSSGITIYSSTTYTMVYLSLFKGTTLIDKETVPIIRGGVDGASYWLVPSTEEVLRYQTAQLSESKLTCAKKRKYADGTAEDATEMKLTYDYVELGVTYSGKSYSSTSGVTLGIWWSKVTFIGKVDGAEVARCTVYIKDTPLHNGDNLINGTNFEDALDSGETKTGMIQSGGVDGSKALYNPGFKSAMASYQELFKSTVWQSSDKRLMPSTWYTLSFWAMAGLNYLTMTENITAAQYGFAKEWAWFTKGSHKITINCKISQEAVKAGKELRIYVWQEDSSGNWTWSASVATTSTSNTTLTLKFEAPSHGLYGIAAYVYEEGVTTITDTTLTATVNYYKVYSAFIHSYVYPSIVDTGYVQVVDGVANPSGNVADAMCIHELTTSWVKHTFTFRTKSSITAVSQYALLRHLCGTASVYICRVKLERGIFATEWCRSEEDKTGGQGLDGCIMRTTQWAVGQEYHNDSALTTGQRFLDIVVTGYGTSEVARFMCRVTHTSTSSGNTAMPTATNTYWTKLDNSFPIYTPLIMADNALIAFTQTNQLLVQDTDGSIIGRMGGGDYLLSLGADAPANAPFRVGKDGKLYATGANITGTINATDGSFSGTLKGVTGSFKSLEALNSSGVSQGSISFYTNGDAGASLNLDFDKSTFNGDLYQQGTKDGRTLRFYAADIRCRGSFGARMRNVLMIGGAYGYYYSKGMESTGTYVSLTSSKDSSGNTYYTIPCYGASGDYSGFPVDTIVFKITSSTTYKYNLSMASSQRVLLINANDDKNNVQFYSNGSTVTLGGGVVREVVQVLRTLLNPTVENTVLGAGLLCGAANDNNW